MGAKDGVARACASIGSPAKAARLNPPSPRQEEYYASVPTRNDRPHTMMPWRGTLGIILLSDASLLSGSGRGRVTTPEGV